MSDETVLPSGQVVGTTPGEAPVIQEPAGQEEVKPEFLTRAEAATLEAKILNEARSYADKGRVRVEKAVSAVTEAVAVMRQHGQEISPEQEKALTAEATRKAMVEPEPTPVTGQPAQAGQAQGQADPEILAIQTEKGVQLFDGDPEVAMIDRTKGLRKFYASLENALEAKKQRLASQPQLQNIPASRLPVLGASSTRLPENMTARAAWQRVEHKK